MSLVVVNKSVFLLGIMLCTSRLFAMDDAAAVCQFCGQPNFEIISKLCISASTGECISPEVCGNAHVECLRANGLLCKTPESELVRNFLSASGFIVGTCVGASLVNFFDGYSSPDNFSEIVLSLNESIGQILSEIENLFNALSGINLD